MAFVIKAEKNQLTLAGKEELKNRTIQYSCKKETHQLLQSIIPGEPTE
jgi:hypothetical protein